MNDLWTTAERLRAVRAAKDRFLTLWAINQAAEIMDRQLGRSKTCPADSASTGASDDWRFLYRGSVLDD